MEWKHERTQREVHLMQSIETLTELNESIHTTKLLSIAHKLISILSVEDTYNAQREPSYPNPKDPLVDWLLVNP